MSDACAVEGAVSLNSLQRADSEGILEAAASKVKAIERPAGSLRPGAVRLRRCAKLSFHPRCGTITIIM
jgi:hypothetical protein